jgi:hypothetical protein
MDVSSNKTNALFVCVSDGVQTWQYFNRKPTNSQLVNVLGRRNIPPLRS